MKNHVQNLPRLFLFKNFQQQITKIISKCLNNKWKISIPMRFCICLGNWSILSEHTLAQKQHQWTCEPSPRSPMPGVIWTGPSPNQLCSQAEAFINLAQMPVSLTSQVWSQPDTGGRGGWTLKILFVLTSVPWTRVGALRSALQSDNNVLATYVVTRSQGYLGEQQCFFF